MPHLPTLGMNFTHVTQEVWYNEDSSQYKVCSGTNGEDPTCRYPHPLGYWRTP